jgi:hypothetical protein
MSVTASPNIEIFTTRDVPISNVSNDMGTCYLDVFKSVKLQINSALQTFRNKNDLIVWLNIKSKDIAEQVNCINLVYEYQIKKLPAIVIDKKYVAYGMRNVSDVLREYYYMENNHA